MTSIVRYRTVPYRAALVGAPWTVVGRRRWTVSIVGSMRARRRANEKYWEWRNQWLLVAREDRSATACSTHFRRSTGAGSALLEVERGELKQILYHPGGRIEALYFPIDAVVSILTSLTDGPSVEIATVGNEGMISSSAVLGSDSMPSHQFAQVQVPGDMLRMDRESFAEVLSENDPFREVIQRYVQALFSQISQQVACNALHSVEERCCRWLLLTHDRAHTETFPITHEFLAQMLGVRRASVTLAASTLQQAGLISYQRGQMTIVDRAGLEDVACECYQVLRDEFDRLLPPPAT